MLRTIGYILGYLTNFVILFSNYYKRRKINRLMGGGIEK